MNTLTQQLFAGEEVVFPGGKQFHLLESSAPLTVEFYGKNNLPLERGEGIEAHFKNTLDFMSVRLTSDIDQIVKIGITSGDAEISRIYGKVDANVVSMPEKTFNHRSYQKTFNCNGLGTYSIGCLNFRADDGKVRTKGRVVMAVNNEALPVWIGSVDDISGYYQRGLYLKDGDTFDLEHTGTLAVGGEGNGTIFYYQTWEE